MHTQKTELQTAPGYVPVSRATMTRFLFMVMVPLLLTSCPSVSTIHGADPVKPGSWEFGAGADALLLRDTEQDTKTPSAQAVFTVRRGILNNLDVGGRLYTVGADISVRWRFWNRKWRAAIIPRLGFIKTSSTAINSDAWHMFSHLPIVFSRNLKPWAILSTGPHLQHGLYLPRNGGYAQGGMGGAFINVAFSINKNWSLVPEMSLMKTMWGYVPLDGTIFQLGIALLWRP